MSEKANILIVDDTEANRRVLENLVVSLGHVPTLAADGEEALSIIDTHLPDLVLLDILMPKLDGYEVLKRIRGKPALRSLPVILISAVDEIDTVVRCIEGGADDYLTKPFNPVLLRARIASCLDRKKLRDAERDFMEKTLRGSVKILMGILSMANPQAFTLGDRVRSYVRHIAQTLHFPNTYLFELGAVFSQIGTITLPAETMRKYLAFETLSPDEDKMVAEFPLTGSKLLEKIPRFKSIAHMVKDQQVPFERFEDVDSIQDRPEGETGAQMLKVAVDFQRLLNGGHSVEKAFDHLSHGVRTYNPDIVSALRGYFGEEKSKPVEWVKIDALSPGMTIGKDVYTVRDVLFASVGEVLDHFWIGRFKNYHANGLIKDEVPILKGTGHPLDLLEEED
jgi:CheY-like chemotaxis protein